MRASAAVALLLLLPLAAHARAEEPGLDDAAGDVVLVASFEGADLPDLPAGPVDRAKASDLVSLRAQETDDSILLTLGVVGFVGDPISARYTFDLRWGGADYRVEAVLHRSQAFGNVDETFASVFRYDGEAWQWVARLAPPTVEVGRATLALEVPKVYMVDAESRIPSRGDVVEVRAVLARGNVANYVVGDLSAEDRMPDAEGKGARLVLERGDYAQGNLIVSTNDRVRVSNGGATTFVFLASVRNTGQGAEEYALGLADVPSGWEASVRSPLRVPPQEERTVSILVSVPFEHVHGGYSSFNLSVQGTQDARSEARMRMGVLHTPIPQPAGHHSELFLHARGRELGPSSEVVNTAFPLSWGWMNTDASHEGDAAYVTPEMNGDRAEWYVPLNPSLELGLDFDVNGAGELTASILGKRDEDVEVRAALVYTYGRGEERTEVPLATATPRTITLARQEPTAFSLVLTPTPESDYLPFRGDAAMYLTISIDGAPTDNVRYLSAFDAQLLTEGFVLSLPLNEYHDKLSGISEAGQAIEIVAQGAVEKVGLPGSVLTYAFTVRNAGEPDILLFELAGNDAREGMLVPRGEFALGQGETRNVTVAVELPIDANPGEEFEVLLFVHAKDDPSKMAIARTKTKATHLADEAAPDETARLLEARAKEQQVPAAGLAWALLVLGALAFARRR